MSIEQDFEHQTDTPKLTVDTNTQPDTSTEQPKYLHSGDLGLELPALDEEGKPVFSKPLDESRLGDAEGLELLRKADPAAYASSAKAYEVYHGAPLVTETPRRGFIKGALNLFGIALPKEAARVPEQDTATQLAETVETPTVQAPNYTRRRFLGVTGLAVTAVATGELINVLSKPNTVTATPPVTKPTTDTTPSSAPTESSTPEASQSPTETTTTPESKVNLDILNAFYAAAESGDFYTARRRQQTEWVKEYVQWSKENNFIMFPTGYGVNGHDPSAATLSDTGMELEKKLIVAQQLPYTAALGHAPAESGVSQPLDQKVANALNWVNFYAGVHKQNGDKVTQGVFKKNQAGIKQGQVGIIDPKQILDIKVSGVRMITTNLDETLPSKTETIRYRDPATGEEHSEACQLVFIPDEPPKNGHVDASAPGWWQYYAIIPQ